MARWTPQQVFEEFAKVAGKASEKHHQWTRAHLGDAQIQVYTPGKGPDGPKDNGKRSRTTVWKYSLIHSETLRHVLLPQVFGRFNDQDKAIKALNEKLDAVLAELRKPTS